MSGGSEKLCNSGSDNHDWQESENYYLFFSDALRWLFVYFYLSTDRCGRNAQLRFRPVYDRFANVEGNGLQFLTNEQEIKCASGPDREE
ncbi:hypothetical protein Tco_0650280 [Tanacetum coccineum]